MITVVTLADAAYAMPLAVMVRSLLDTLAPSRGLRIVIADGGIPARDKSLLQASWETSEAWPRTSVEYVSPVYGDSAELPVWGRVPVLTYSRIGIADYVSKDCARLIVLDSDVLALTDVGRLFDVDLGSAIIGATQDPYVPLVSSLDGLACYSELGLAKDRQYFNAGVMVVDMQRWRKARVAERAFDFVARQWRSLRHYDQDSLNAVLAHDWMELDSRWQSQPRVRHSLGLDTRDPFIVHFSGRLKPWVYCASSDADIRFYAVLNRTAWRGWRPPNGFQAMAYRAYDSPLRRILYPVERRILSWQNRIQDRRRAPPA